MKKVCFIFSLILLLSGLSFPGAKFYSLVAPNPTCGNQINVEVWVDNADDLIALQWRINFDNTAFSYSSLTLGPVLAGWLYAVNPQPTYVNFAAATAFPIPPGSGSQMLVSFTFNTLTTVCNGATPVFQLRLVLWSTSTEWDVPGNDFDLNVTVSCPANPQISIPSNPFPADGATNQPTTLTLNWDDSTGADTYDLYFGTTSPPPYYATTAISQYDVAGLATDTQYFWYVVADNSGNTCPPQTGTMWTFTTTCVPPSAFNNLAPANGATGQPINGLLIDWQDSTGATAYDLYFGTTSPPPLYQSDLVASNYTANGLSYGTQYFWYVVAKNTCGNTTGAEWSFTTMAPVSVDLSYDSSSLTDYCFTGGPGNANGVMDPGESIYLTVTLVNNGAGGATNVQATLSTTTPGVNITTNSAAYPDIPASGTGASLTPYIFDIVYTIACGSTIDFTLNITADQGTWTDSFQLTVGSTNPLILGENFDLVAPPSLPPNWTSVVVNNPGGTAPAWATNAGTHHPAGRPPYSSPNLVWFNSWHVTAGKSARLQYEVPFDFTPYLSVTFSFWMYHDTGYSTNNDRVQVQVSTNGGTSWTDVGSPVPRYNGTTGWAEYLIDLSAYAGQSNVMVGILGISAYGNDCHLDDLKIYGTSPTPLCNVCTPPMPNLSVQSTSYVDDCAFGGAGDGDDIIDPGEDINLTIILTNTGTSTATGISGTLSTSTPGVTVTDNFGTFPNIVPGGAGTSDPPHFSFSVDPTVPCGTAINFNLHIVSNENPGGWDSAFSLTVGNFIPPGIITDFIENFDSVSPPALPAGWTTEVLSGNAWVTYAGFSCSPPNVLNYLYHSTQPADSWVFTPGILLDASNTYTLNFNMRVASASYPENLEVWIGTAPNSGSQTQLLWSQSNITNTTCQLQSVNFTVPSTGTYYIGFHCTSAADMWRMIVDDISVTHPQPASCSMNICSSGCPTPLPFNNLSPPDVATNQPLNGVIIDWEDSVFATSYDLYFGTTSPPPLLISDLFSSNYTVNGLLPGTTYHWYVIAKNTCGTTTGAEWSFTTCFVPGIFNNISPANGAIDQPINGLLIDWEDSTGATAYDLYLGTTAPPPLYQSNLITSNYTANGLSPNRTYYWYVVAKNSCGNTIGAQWSFNTIIVCQVVAYGFDLLNSNLVWFDLATPGTFNVVGSIGSDAPFGGDFIGGDYSRIYAIDFLTNQFLYYSTSNAVKTVLGTSTPNSSAPYWTGLAEHPSGTVYGISTNCSSTTWLYTINPSNGAATAIAQVPGVACPINLAADLSGNLYTFDIASDNVYSINPSTGTPTLLGAAGFDGNYAQGMDYDIDNSIMYMAAYNYSTSRGELRTVNLSTGATTLIGPFEGNTEVDGIAIVSCMTGPNLLIQSTNFVDSCSSGGPGDGNGIAEPGEILNISPIIQNSGTSGATNVTATLSTANPLVTILIANASYGDISNGASAPPATPFQVLLDPTIGCPSTIDFTLNINANEGNWIRAFQINVGGTGSSTLLLNENFESWPPAGWTIVDEQPGWSCDVWQSTAYWGVSNDTGGAGEAADADSDACGDGMDTSLITPPIDLTGFSSASLEYRCNFQDYAGNGDAWTDISTDGGATWTNLRYETTDDPTSGHLVSIDLTPYVGNTIQIRFHFYTPDWDWFWQVDEVRVEGITSNCNICGCSPPVVFNLLAPPNNATGVPISGITLDWQDSTGATSYNLYFGTAAIPPLYQTNIASSQYFVGPLSPSTTYRWRVGAVNSCGSTLSSIWSFTTETGCIPPDTPQLISPPNGSTGLVPPVEFVWTGSNADYYEFYLGTAPNQLQLLGTTTSTSYTVSNLEEGKTYYWLVNAINFCGNASSATWSFATAGAPPVETYTTLIPVVASAHGARSSNWVTDLQIFNPTDKLINFSLYFVPPEIDGTKTPYIYTSTIEPKKLKIFKDVVSEIFQLSEIAGALQIVSDGRLIATARVYNQTENGTYGQFIKGYNINDAVYSEGAKYIIRGSEVGHIIHLTNSILFRTNIGFVEVLGKQVKVNLSIYDDFNNLLGSSSYNLLPMGFLQINDVFANLGIGGLHQAARAEIKIEGEGAVFGYGSMVDNNSNDAIFVPTLKEVGNLKAQSIGVAVHTQGDKGTFWKSDLRVFNLSEEEQEITFKFMEKGETFTKTFTIAGKHIMNANDALQQIFELNANYGNMLITAPEGILTTSRIYTITGERSTYGQFVPSTSSHNPIKLNEFQYLLHLSQNEDFRTNLGLSEISGKSATVKITLYNKNGTELSSGTYNLSGYELRQVNRIFEVFNAGEVENGYAKVSVISGEGSVLVYASVVDNLTGDAIYVVGQ